ncbi:class A beta-lactamase [Oryzisolibacter sp. LB2S]|uniref:class A beta-lactamase n=1 Tax=Alicycliphilus soli TaxID=3228789 RepID=UPI003458B790
MKRRAIHRLALAACGMLLHGAARADTRAAAPALWQDIEHAAQGRLGVAVIDTQTGTLTGHRLDERFPMCSVFKWLAAAHVLHRVDRGVERLDRALAIDRAALLPWSPVTEQHADASLPLSALCEAAVAMSDNAAANLILQTLGGPEGLTRFARRLGDPVTRLDRWEPDLNTATPGDARDTSSPRAMAQLLQRCVLGEVLSAGGRRQLAQWLQATTTNRKRLGAGLPASWRLGSKTGTGAHGTTNDVGIYWPPGRAPLVVALFLTESQASLETREAALARVAGAVMGHFAR